MTHMTEPGNAPGSVPRRKPKPSDIILVILFVGAIVSGLMAYQSSQDSQQTQKAQAASEAREKRINKCYRTAINDIATALNTRQEENVKFQDADAKRDETLKALFAAVSKGDTADANRLTAQLAADTDAKIAALDKVKEARGRAEYPEPPQDVCVQEENDREEAAK